MSNTGKRILLGRVLNHPKLIVNAAVGGNVFLRVIPSTVQPIKMPPGAPDVQELQNQVCVSPVCERLGRLYERVLCNAERLRYPLCTRLVPEAASSGVIESRNDLGTHLKCEAGGVGRNTHSFSGKRPLRGLD